jgi:methyl-accepting chemotaxis protein
MKHLSISSKLLWITSILFLMTVTILSLSLWWALTDKNTQLSEDIQRSLHEETQAKLAAMSAEYGEMVAGFINESYRVPYTFAGILEQTGESGVLERTEVETSLAAMLQKNKQLSSIYAQFEVNGYDGLDDIYRAGDTHSVPGIGTLEIYHWRDENGSVEQEQVTNADEKYISTLNEFGNRVAEWFLCAKETKQPCLMEPYSEDVTAGNTVQMTSLTVPVIINQQFRGVVGADINLSIFQQLIQQLSKKLYQGKAKVTLLSAQGLVVAASHITTVGRPLTESMDAKLAKTYLALHKGTGYLETNKNIVVSHPIKIGLADNAWSLVIEVPKEIAYAAANALDLEMKETASSLGRLQLTLGIVVSIIAIFAIYLLVRSIIAPLKLIQSRVENLASNEGDLTQSLAVDSHAELIALGGGFNAFIAKLKYLIDDLKDLTGKSHIESLAVANTAQHTKESVQRQYGEIESVVAAINEMSATALEVAKASEKTAVETDAMSKNVQQSQASLTKAMDYVNTMSAESIQAKDAVNKVADSSHNISSILEVIRSIADQTNLLALNAAIEAARAGEQGRGFAVVADEVRALASKTQRSTNDISQLIDALQHEVNGAADIIDKGAERAQSAVAQTEDALETINAMVGQINEVSCQVTQIATAAEEQSLVTEEVNRNITGISNSAAELASLADEALQSSTTLADLVGQQNQHLSKLKT